jgi:acetyltransferase-like isoleucine patch superfamily enzyme
MRNLQRFELADKAKNSLAQWKKAQNPLRVVFNFCIVEICKFCPFLKLKNRLYRLIGIKIGKNTAIAPGVTFDFFFPELIEIGENCIIGYGALILGHEFLHKEYTKGKVIIGKDVLIGANSTVLPGVKIGDGAKISAMSLVNCDIPPNCLAGGIPAKKIKKI